MANEASPEEEKKECHVTTEQKMPVITFSHLYPKLLDEHNDMIETATLLDVVLVNLEDQSPAFMAYDTDNGKYPLPKKGAP